MTVYEKYLKALDDLEQIHKAAVESLDAILEAEQEVCKHKWGEVNPHMFYALGNTAPGKSCIECGMKVHVK